MTRRRGEHAKAAAPSTMIDAVHGTGSSRLRRNGSGATVRRDTCGKAPVSETETSGRVPGASRRTTPLARTSSWGTRPGGFWGREDPSISSPACTGCGRPYGGAPTSAPSSSGMWPITRCGRGLPGRAWNGGAARTASGWRSGTLQLIWSSAPEGTGWRSRCLVSITRSPCERSAFRWDTPGRSDRHGDRSAPELATPRRWRQRIALAREESIT